MKKLLVLLVMCVLLLTGCAKNEGYEKCASTYWRGEKEHVTLSIHLFASPDGLWSFLPADFSWERYDFPNGIDVIQLDGDDHRMGTWSVKGDVLTLKFDNGEVLTGTISEDELLLDYDGGFLLKNKPY